MLYQILGMLETKVALEAISFSILIFLMIGFFFFNCMYLFILGCAGSPLWCRLVSGCGERGGPTLLLQLRGLIAVVSLVAQPRLWHTSFSSCGMQAL